jgi:hypothetical protein
VFQNKEVNGENRKQWAQPVVRRLSAGAAETGNRVNEDGSTETFNARS